MLYQLSYMRTKPITSEFKEQSIQKVYSFCKKSVVFLTGTVHSLDLFHCVQKLSMSLAGRAPSRPSLYQLSYMRLSRRSFMRRRTIEQDNTRKLDPRQETQPLGYNYPMPPQLEPLNLSPISAQRNFNSGFLKFCLLLIFIGVGTFTYVQHVASKSYVHAFSRMEQYDNEFANLKLDQHKTTLTPVPVQPSPGSEQVFCTMDAMMCPDGSYVGRSGPKCEFVCP